MMVVLLNLVCTDEESKMAASQPPCRHAAELSPPATLEQLDADGDVRSRRELCAHQPLTHQPQRQPVAHRCAKMFHPQGKVDAPQAAQAETGDTKDQVMALVATVSSAYKILLVPPISSVA